MFNVPRKLAHTLHEHLLSFDNVTDAPPRRNPANIPIYLILLETRIIGQHFAAEYRLYSETNFIQRSLVGSVTRFSLQQCVSAAQASRSSKVIDFGNNGKRV